MIDTHPKALNLLPGAAWSWGLVFVVVASIVSCGGKSAHTPGAESSESGVAGGTGGATALAASSSGGTEPASGGSGGAAVGTTPSSGGQQAGDTFVPPPGSVIELGGNGGSETSAGGAAEDACDISALWIAISFQAGVTACYEASPMLEPDEHLSAIRGAVVIDDEGRVVDNTGLRIEENKQHWLDDLANQRWPCLAGQTIGYQCLNPD